jgi:hypothetical protein
MDFRFLFSKVCLMPIFVFDFALQLQDDVKFPDLKSHLKKPNIISHHLAVLIGHDFYDFTEL